MFNWQPSASFERLKERALFLKEIRRFFDERGVYEVDTPVLCQGVGTDPCLAPFAVNIPAQKSQWRYLQTSPEFSMKRLVAAGSGPIYYLGKAFRFGEIGSRHNPEFTMLEWYRPGWDHFRLIQEVDDLMQGLLGTKPATVTTYADLFLYYFDIQPHFAPISALQEISCNQDWISKDNLPDLDKDGWLDLLMSHGIEPHLGQENPIVVTDYPASQASLAKTRTIEGPTSYQVAERFEFYYKGIELTNGYHELSCATEQAARFAEDIAKRKALGIVELPMDEYLLAALQVGFPPCAGVALGVDRLFMLKTGEKDIKKVIPFEWERA
ncbi:MAG: EF-P lysine aminoacylase EpmA [Candidatus Berkiella sp.]